MTALLTVVLVLAVEKFEMTNEYGLLVFAYSIIGVILDVLIYLTIENDIPLRLTEEVMSKFFCSSFSPPFIGKNDEISVFLHKKTKI